jgi:hypothetical protein
MVEHFLEAEGVAGSSPVLGTGYVIDFLVKMLFIKIKGIQEWLQRNERHISAPIFIAGFISDLFTVAPLSITYAVYLYGIYLVVAFLAAIGAHYLHVRMEEEGPVLRGTRIMLSLVAQFMNGGLLSGCLIFYTKGASLAASWPFVVLLAAVFIGNEFLRKYREQLAFRNILFFFALYAYVLYAFPTLVHTITPQTFLESTGISLAVFLLYLCAIALAGWHRFKESFFRTMLGAALIAGAVTASYFYGIIPPLPLSLSEGGVYNSVSKADSYTYVLQSEENLHTHAWWNVTADFTPVTVYVVPGSSLSVFSSVFAPIAFTTAIVHKWEYLDPVTHKWQTRAVIAFSIAGGRDGGYRGYSTLSSIQPGSYKVLIETISGQVIGQIRFSAVATTTTPVVFTEYR